MLHCLPRGSTRSMSFSNRSGWSPTSYYLVTDLQIVAWTKIQNSTNNSLIEWNKSQKITLQSLEKTWMLMAYHQVTNRNLQYLINMLIEFELICASTKFREWPDKIWIFFNLSNRKAQLYVVLINKTWKKVWKTLKHTVRLRLLALITKKLQQSLNWVWEQISQKLQ